MAAMDLHGNFARPEFRSYLFVKHSRHNQGHNFTLTHGERRIALPHLREVTLVLARLPVAIQCLMNGIQQVLVAEWLGQELHSAGFHSLHGHGDIAVPSDENDRDLDACASQFMLKLQTVDARKPDVQNQATWSVRPLPAQELLGCSEG